MGIKLAGNQSQPLFHSVDAHWQGKGHIFSVLPQFESEARETIAGLACKCRHEVNPESASKFFTSEAIQRSMEQKYDKESKKVTFEEDEILEALLDNPDDLDYEHLGDVATDTSTDQVQMELDSILTNVPQALHDGQDSIGTFYQTGQSHPNATGGH